MTIKFPRLDLLNNKVRFVMYLSTSHHELYDIFTSSITNLT